ncbi:MAG TPA: serine hydrolase, partial [Trebonia sp.]|nr:serine hydrolase [Trebonia sp.]
KVFTTELLADLVADGKLRLTDPLQADAPPGVTIPGGGERPITLLDLATHSAGLPREMGFAPEGTAPFTWPTPADRWKWFSSQTLGWPPGTVAAYSNVGFDLLADALATAAAKSYSALLKERVTDPAGMTDTGLAPTSEQCARLMTGSGIGGPGPCADTEATGGSGGLYSTGDDMVRKRSGAPTLRSGWDGVNDIVHGHRHGAPGA